MLDMEDATRKRLVVLRISNSKKRPIVPVPMTSQSASVNVLRTCRPSRPVAPVTTTFLSVIAMLVSTIILMIVVTMLYRSECMMSVVHFRVFVDVW